MARIITKGLVGQQDISIGTGTFTRATSTGGTQTLNQVPIFQTGVVTPTGAINGVNVTFILSPAPSSTTLFVLIFLNGLLQQAGASNDYTISGSTVTFNTAPPTGSILLAVY